MKYLLVLAVVLVAIHVWRNNRRLEREETRRPEPRAPKEPQAPAVMVACLHCGTHVPQAESVRGSLGPYCCAEHRQLHGDRAA